jgi:hypothetical protein
MKISLKLGLLPQLLLVFVVAFFFGEMIPEFYRSLFYTVSVQIQEILIFFLPFVIFSYLFSCFLGFEDNILVFIVSLVIFMVVSNFLSMMYSYGVGVGCFSFIKATAAEINMNGLKHLGCIRLPKIPNDYALISGTSLGVFFFYFRNKTAAKISAFMKNGADFFLKKMFIPVVPLFIFGFMLKMATDGALDHAVKTYAPVFAAAIIASAAYTVFMFGIASRFRFRDWKRYIRNSIPMALTGFSTMSSAATMPLLFDSAEKNTNHSPVVKAYVPATINIHHVGDGIVFPIVMMTTMLTFGMAIPDLSTYLVFAGYYLILKFGAAAVPGGGAMVMMPILTSIMGFDATMQGFMLGLYMLFDPFITVTNTMCNGASVIVFARIFDKRKKAA